MSFFFFLIAKKLHAITCLELEMDTYYPFSFLASQVFKRVCSPKKIKPEAMAQDDLRIPMTSTRKKKKKRKLLI